VTLDAAGDIYIAEYIDNRILKVSPAGVIGTFAGNGLLAISADGSPATEFGIPQGVAFDTPGNFYATSGYLIAVYRFMPNGVLTMVAGGGGGSPAPAAMRFPPRFARHIVSVSIHREISISPKPPPIASGR